ncbi:MAG: hypothetical protein U5K37_03735 [Natrialbaceae archaeon]|nr:hypothetical protein [Natrialbaceae archaeon]
MIRRPATSCTELQSAAEFEDTTTEDVLEQDSPDDIIACAAEPEVEESIDADLTPDDDTVEELLIDRTEEEGFLWIDE